MNRIVVKRFRRAALLVLAASIGIYFAPYVTLFFFICGAIDIARHKKINYSLIEKYFMGNGILTWLLSPINLFADLLSFRNKGVYRLEDLPPEHRAEIEECVNAFTRNGDAIKEHISKTLGKSGRGMLTFKWFNVRQSTELKIPEFEREYRYIKTVAVSVFNTRQQTSWHFGPLRFTFRVLRNLEAINSRDVHIEVDNTIHYWIDDPLFIFDDTFLHRSTNNVDAVRYCLFMDLVRPNHAQAVFDRVLDLLSFVASSMKTLFYKNWSLIR